MSGYKTLIGAAVALLAEIARLAGLDIGDPELLVNDILIIGGVALAIYGRVAATRDLKGGKLK